jgi:hypothetical protein
MHFSTSLSQTKFVAGTRTNHKYCLPDEHLLKTSRNCYLGARVLGHLMPRPEK